MTEGSGRKVMAIPLPALPIDAWEEVESFTAWKERAERSAGIRHLILSCAGRPRSLMNGLAKVEWPQVTAAALSRA